jgi:hypothetical protein
VDVEEFRTKPSWEAYEATLLIRGFIPASSRRNHHFLSPCCRCGTVSTYVVLTDGITTLGFVVCPPCGEWIGRAITGQTAGA